MNNIQKVTRSKAFLIFVLEFNNPSEYEEGWLSIQFSHEMGLGDQRGLFR